MLEALINYNTEPTESGYKPKDVRWSICFNDTGEFLDVVELGEVNQKNNRGQEFLKCPDFNFSEMKAHGITKSHFLVETAEVVSLHSKNPDERKLKEKHNYFIYMLKDAGTAMPELANLGDYFEQTDVLSRIRERLSILKAKPTDKVTFRIGNNYPVDSDVWHQWWQNLRSSLVPAKAAEKNKGHNLKYTVRCFVTGELVEPVRVAPKISGLADVGGMTAGDALCSFKQESFCSYGFEQASNAAVSEQATNAYRAALERLIKDHSQRLAGAKIVHWFKEKNITIDDDPLSWLEESKEQQERNAQQRAKELLEAIRTGKRPDLADNVYYALTLSGASGRVMVRDWIEGQFEELIVNILNWFEDFSIVHRTGGFLAPNPKFLAVLGATVRELNELNPPFVAKIWRVAVKDEPIPAYCLSQVLGRFKMDIIKDNPINHAGMGLLKAYIIRKERKGGVSMSNGLKPYLNDEHPHPAYHCGRLMAVLAGLQRAALGDVGAGVVQRYFAAASSTPALVLGRLTRNSQVHLNKLNGGMAHWYEGKIADIWKRIEDGVPKTLTLEEQSIFALGYYQQMADMHKKTNENDNSKKEGRKDE